MTFSDIARWLLGRRETKPRPPRPSASFPAKGKSTRPSASFPAKGKSTRSSASFTAKEKSPGQHGSGQRAARHGRKRIGEVDEWRVDKEIDGFVVLAEGGDWTSCSDSDESDWSIGWFERLSSEFSSDNESDNSFAVLVPCYGPSSRKALNSRGKQNKKTSILDMIQSNSSSKDSQKCVDKWLASLNLNGK